MFRGTLSMSAGCKENQFSSFSFGQAIAMIYSTSLKVHVTTPKNAIFTSMIVIII